MDRDIMTTSITIPGENTLHEYTFSVQALGRGITAVVLLPDEGIHVSVFGGDRSHIGAVSVISPDGSRQDTEFPGHRDGTVASKWAGALYAAGYSPAVVECGIHYDGIGKDGIRQILECTDRLLSEILHLPDSAVK